MNRFKTQPQKNNNSMSRVLAHIYAISNNPDPKPKSKPCYLLSNSKNNNPILKSNSSGTMAPKRKSEVSTLRHSSQIKQTQSILRSTTLMYSNTRCQQLAKSSDKHSEWLPIQPQFLNINILEENSKPPSPKKPAQIPFYFCNRKVKDSFTLRGLNDKPNYSNNILNSRIINAASFDQLKIQQTLNSFVDTKNCKKQSKPGSSHQRSVTTHYDSTIDSKNNLGNNQALIVQQMNLSPAKISDSTKMINELHHKLTFQQKALRSRRKYSKIRGNYIGSPPLQNKMRQSAELMDVAKDDGTSGIKDILVQNGDGRHLRNVKSAVPTMNRKSEDQLKKRLWRKQQEILLDESFGKWMTNNDDVQQF